jgi:putative flippase GtrA
MSERVDRTTLWQAVRFVIVGGTAAAGYIAVATVLETLAAFPHWAASMLAYASMIGPAYMGHRLFAFRATTEHAQSFPRYLSVQLLCLVLSGVFASIIGGMIALNPIVLYFVVAAILAVISFVLTRLWVFAS